VQYGPSFGGGDDDPAAGGAVKKGILAGLVEIKSVMSVLERGYFTPRAINRGIAWL
jgi:hypothetical protein